jgi:hydrocephalus-inducing protein
VDGRITATYKDHPRRDVVPCKGDINFPNVTLDRTAVDFGCLLNDTVASQTVVVTNVTKLPLDLGWSFVWDEAAAVAEAEAAGQPYVPINKVFDVRPLRCHLLPGDTMPVDFVYYGHAGRRFATTAVCEVAGGPEYAVSPRRGVRPCSNRHMHPHTPPLHPHPPVCRCR